jgi:hypothetical protein
MRVLPRLAMKSSNGRRLARAGFFGIVGVVGLGAFAAAAADAVAESEGSEIARRWIPSASLLTTGFVDQRSARMESDTSPYRDGDSLGLLWSIGGTADVASPVILDVPGKPRAFAHADVGFVYSLEDPITTEGDPGGTPRLVEGSNTVEAIAGVGSSVRAEAKPLVLSGGIGSVFEMEVLERGVRIRPTLEWMYRRDTMKATLGGAESESLTPGESECVPDCRTVFIKHQTEKGYHSLGPGIELEADAGRMGDFLLGFYGSFRAYYLVGDRKANLRSRGSWRRLDGSPTTREDTTFVTRYERDPWHYRFGMGFRVLWSPED